MRRVLFLATGVFVILIGAVLLVAPEIYIRLYIVEYAPGMDFAARRFAPALVGLGALLLFARDLPSGRFLTALCAITGVVFWGVAATGLHAWSTDVAKPSILVAAAVEVILGALFLRVAWVADTSTK